MTSLIRVEVDPDNSNFDFTLQGTFASGVNWFIGIEGPFGTIKAVNFSSVDATGAPATVSIPSTDPIQVGDYKITVYEWSLSAPGGVRVPKVLHQYDLCYEPERPFVLQVSDDCVNLTAKDITEYPTLATPVDFARVITVGYPFIDKIVTPPDEVLDAETNIVSMAQPDGKVYEFVEWDIKGSSSGTFAFASGVWDVQYFITYTQDAVRHLVQCSLDLCAAVDCVDKFWSALAAKACNVGGLSKLPANEFDKVTTLIGHLSLYAHYVNCNDRPNAVRYYNLIKDITGSACTIGEEPSVVKYPVPGQRVWYPVLPGEFDSGYGSVTGNELSASVTNGMLVFKGKFTSSSFNAAGLKMLDKDFFDRIGVSIVSSNTALFADSLVGSGDIVCGTVYPNGGDLWVKPSGGSFNINSEYTIQGTFAIEITQ